MLTSNHPRRWTRCCQLALLAALTLTGCTSSSPSVSTGAANSNAPDADASAEPTSSVPLRVSVVDDPALAQAIEAQWTSIAEQSIVVRSVTATDLEATTRTLDADVVIFPTAELGTLVERRQLVPVPDEIWNGPRLNRRDLLDLPRQREAVWGEQVFGVPLGSRTLTLWYRADLFESLGLEPPTTWADYHKLAERLTKRDQLGERAPPADAPWTGTLEPTGPEWGGAMLMVRAAAYARHRSQYSTLFDFSSVEPLLTAAPFTRAADELLATARLAQPNNSAATPDDARRALLAGRCAMAIAWTATNNAATDSDANASADNGVRIGVAPLPGAAEMYNLRQKKWEERRPEENRCVPVVGLSGRLGATTRECRRSRIAWNFLTLLANADWSTSVLTKSPATGLYRRDQLRAPEVWVGRELGGDALRQYIDALLATNQTSSWFSTIRIPGHREYRSALDASIQKMLSGETPPAEALEAATKAWREITEKRGLEAQRGAYRRDLGLEK